MDHNRWMWARLARYFVRADFPVLFHVQARQINRFWSAAKRLSGRRSWHTRQKRRPSGSGTSTCCRHTWPWPFRNWSIGRKSLQTWQKRVPRALRAVDRGARVSGCLILISTGPCLKYATFSIWRFDCNLIEAWCWISSGKRLRSTPTFVRVYLY